MTRERVSGVNPIQSQNFDRSGFPQGKTFKRLSHLHTLAAVWNDLKVLPNPFPTSGSLLGPVS